MPIEIRELIIKTEISTSAHQATQHHTLEDLDEMKKQIIEECKRMIKDQSSKNIFKR